MPASTRSMNRIRAFACMLGVTWISVAASSNAMIRKPALEEAPSSFFRVMADYTVIETGEKINFDYVVGCGGIVANYSYTTPSVIYEAHPSMQYIATEQGAAIGVKTPGILCDPRYFAFVPADFRPFMMWFPDVDDMSFAWGYSTIRAYESSAAKVQFNGASVEPATQMDWEESRKELAAKYTQIGALPGPWGYSFSRTPVEESVQIVLKGRGFGLAETCHGYSRLPLSLELVEELFSDAPEQTDRFWLLSDIEFESVADRLQVIKFDGRPFNDYVRHTEGTVQDTDGGTIANKFDYDALAEVYPVLPTRQTMESAGVDLTSPPAEYARKILFEADRNGFSACWSSGDPTVVPYSRSSFFERPEFVEHNRKNARRNPYDEAARNKPNWLYLNNTKLGQNQNRPPLLPPILDREGYIYFSNGWGFIQL